MLQIGAFECFIAGKEVIATEAGGLAGGGFAGEEILVDGAFFGAQGSGMQPLSLPISSLRAVASGAAFSGAPAAVRISSEGRRSSGKEQSTVVASRRSSRTRRWRREARPSPRIRDSKSIA